MNLPKQRLTINVAEYSLLKPGLDLLANRLADAKSGHFPYRHTWPRTDREASDIYRDQEFSPEMSARIISARRKLWNLTQSRKIYLDTFELSALALALRLTRSRKLIDTTEAILIAIKALASKIEIYRKRAKRSAIAKVGTVEYQSGAKCWRRNLSWLHDNTLCPTPRWQSKPWRAQRWRDQRIQTSQLIKTVLEENFYEAALKVQVQQT